MVFNLWICPGFFLANWKVCFVGGLYQSYLTYEKLKLAFSMLERYVEDAEVKIYSFLNSELHRGVCRT